MLFKQLTTIALLGLLVACGSNAPKTSSGPLVDSDLKVFTYGDAYNALEKKLRLVHGRQLSNTIAEQKLFNSSEYIGDGRDISGHKTTLRVTFLYAQQGADEWPLEIKAHYILENADTTVFNEVYQVKATQFNAPAICSGCSAEETALKMLLKKALPELKLAL